MTHNPSVCQIWSILAVTSSLAMVGFDAIQDIARRAEIHARLGEFDYVLLLRAESAMRMNARLDEMGDIKGVIKTATAAALAWEIDRP